MRSSAMFVQHQSLNLLLVHLLEYPIFESERNGKAILTIGVWRPVLLLKILLMSQNEVANKVSAKGMFGKFVWSKPHLRTAFVNIFKLLF